MKKSFLLLVVACFWLAGVFAQTGAIENLQVAQRTDGSGLVDIHFDLNGQGEMYNISLEVSFDDGVNYASVNKSSLSGDFFEVTPGLDNQIIWDGKATHPNIYSPQTKIKIIAKEVVEEVFVCGVSKIIDFDGNEYSTVQIGEQCWMQENLKTTKYQNGEPIKNSTNNEAWISDTEGSYVWYENSIIWKDKYGALYNRFAVNNANQLCPEGWHVPSGSEFEDLIGFVSGIYSNSISEKLMSCRQVDSYLGGDCSTTTHPRWNKPWQNWDAFYGTDASNFSALPSGSRNFNGESLWFSGLGQVLVLWSLPVSTGDLNRIFSLTWSNNGGIRLDYPSQFQETNGSSIRCIKNDF